MIVDLILALGPLTSRSPRTEHSGGKHRPTLPGHKAPWPSHISSMFTDFAEARWRSCRGADLGPVAGHQEAYHRGKS